MSELDWRDNHLPVSTRFDDPYYSRHDGRAETSHVFIQGNRLTERWPDMQNCTIGELGFGTGLNFLETVRRWKTLKPVEAALTFISFEQFPISGEDMARALNHWPELASLKERLLELWTPEFEIIDTSFDQDVRLVVFMSDANVRLPQLEIEADAWYLDGFSPAKNPELWNQKLMAEIAYHTVAGGTFATYSAAGFVRRNLQKAGFHVRKAQGFGSKRDMLVGNKLGDIDVADGY